MADNGCLEFKIWWIYSISGG